MLSREARRRPDRWPQCEPLFVVKLVKASLNGNEGATDGDTHATVQNKGAGAKTRPRNNGQNRTTEPRSSGGGWPADGGRRPAGQRRTASGERWRLPPAAASGGGDDAAAVM